MTTEQMLCQAIQDRRQIVYTYFRHERAEGKRFGNPHIVYHGKSGLLVHIWKLGGVKTEPDKSLPDWRLYLLEHLRVICIENQKTRFLIEQTFKPQSPMYRAGIVCQV